jgi:hypothetical protein
MGAIPVAAGGRILFAYNWCSHDWGSIYHYDDKYFKTESNVEKPHKDKNSSDEEDEEEAIII